MSPRIFLACKPKPFWKSSTELDVAHADIGGGRAGRTACQALVDGVELAPIAQPRLDQRLVLVTAVRVIESTDGGLCHQECAENVQKRSKHLLGLSRPPRNQPVRNEQRYRSQHRHNKPHRIPWAVPADCAAKEAADDGPHNA
jgi:hypothetical protein